MKSILKTMAIVLTLAFTAGSCSSDDDNNSGSSSRDVKYEVTGNYTGKLDVTYTEAGGGALNEDITALPWTKDITVAASTLGVGLSASGYGGVSGQKLTVKIYVGGKVVKDLTATANGDGIIVAVPGAYAFPL
ncbi:MmpS family transport accessory protein [Flavobacterium sp. FlaQc-48]|uniref:MmpS family transport accessory protein n=1 Tax=Flavobacterium sp. FlaQc-48 TaxID=3374181 RepID=UPI0037568176